MGLDNSIHFRFWKKGSKSVHTFEVCYWRKYWNVRREILNELHDEFINTEDCPYIIPTEDASILESIADILKKFCKISCCKKNTDCPWDASEQAYHNRNELMKLSFLIELVKGEISIKDFFYAAQCWDFSYFKEDYLEMVEFDEIEYEVEYIDSY